jgi:hypothetical protein
VCVRIRQVRNSRVTAYILKLAASIFVLSSHHGIFLYRFVCANHDAVYGHPEPEHFFIKYTRS